VNVYDKFDCAEAERRFNAAVGNCTWENLPVEAALLFPLPRLPWPKLQDDDDDDDDEDKVEEGSKKEVPGEEIAEEKVVGEENADDEHQSKPGQEDGSRNAPKAVNKPKKGRDPVAPLKTDVPFLPKKYPRLRSDMPNTIDISGEPWSELKEFFCILLGVDEGDMAVRVPGHRRNWVGIRNAIRRRIHSKRDKARVLDDRSTVTRTDSAGTKEVTQTAKLIVNGGPIGGGKKTMLRKLTDEQLLFVSHYTLP
jgi:hypothetical protein